MRQHYSQKQMIVLVTCLRRRFVCWLIKV